MEIQRPDYAKMMIYCKICMFVDNNTIKERKNQQITPMGAFSSNEEKIDEIYIICVRKARGLTGVYSEML